MKVLIINGPNLNMLGQREEDLYGQLTLEEINALIIKKAESIRVEVEFFQSNEEGRIVSTIQESAKVFDYIIINPAAFTHTSIAIRDALLSVKSKFIEVHLSNIFSREDFRQNSFVSSIALGVISGFGHEGYLMALDALNNIEK
ncbi:type II 3-dehydroquinate dehydratase [bacterium]|jgi:3-dehydroquinate dehydratase-2|nr:type II 3-dehydroquinate dehydratase [bacterium]MBT3849836.1 type II 3-dehydroquinate dehydratase [bacterium]MBT4434975.1 type II 3-dehydroquinate dehydratase [bacterium]MDG2445650.1 type II 3-dehydroquinate dehydratase [Thermodesulfobacteriota bacterium]|tara:strand:- start:5456 stop:5887 length:432 start_codon:yes stop_codon:yes gene_type:complete